MAKAEITVLILEDNPAWQKQLERAVKRLGFAVITTKDPQKAASLISKHRPHAIVADINLQDWDPQNKKGFELLEAFAPGDRPPTIVVTGFAEFENVRHALKDLNVVDILSKGDFDESAFRDALKAAVKRSSARA